MKTLVFVVLIMLTSAALSGQNLKFDFGHGKIKKGYTQVTPETNYTPQRGFGFDYGTQPASEVYNGHEPLTRDYCTSTKPFYFSVDLPAGNYDVTVVLGRHKGPSFTMVKAESCRVMLDEVSTKKNEMVRRTFTVNIRPVPINDTDSIVARPCDKPYLNGDNKLTLEFAGTLPSVAAVEIVVNKTDPSY